MSRFSDAIKRSRVTIFFIIIEIVAVGVYVRQSVYANAKVLNIVGQRLHFANNWADRVHGYFGLEAENKALAEQNTMLLERILKLEGEIDAVNEHAELEREDMSGFTAITATVMRNSISNTNNYITLNKGSNDGVEENMSVVSGSSITGSIVSVSPNLSIAMSALSKDFRTSGMFRRDGTVCLVYWDGVSARRFAFTEASKYSQINVGDTVVTTRFSLIFPEDILIGTVESVEPPNASHAFVSGTIRPFTDFERARYVSIIDHTLLKEGRELERKIAR